MKNAGLRFGIVIAVLALTVWLLVPSIQFYALSEAEQENIRRDTPHKLKRILNLGLDLQGGMRLVLEIDGSKLDDDARKDAIDRAYAIIENRINQLGVAEPILQKQGRDRIIVELPGIKDEKVAKEVIGKTAQLEFNLVRDDADRERALAIIEATVSGGKSPDDEAKSAEAAEAKDQANQELADKLFGGSDTTAADSGSAPAGGDDALNDPFSAAGTFRSLIEMMGGMTVVKNESRARVNEILRRDDVRRALDRAGLGGNSFLWGYEDLPASNSSSTYKYLYYVKSAPEMKGDVIKNAMATIDQSGGMNAGRAKVDFELNAAGARSFTRVTSHNLHKQLSIVLDSTVYSAPRIQSRISGGRAEITGSFTMEEAKALSIILRAGALPAPVNIIEERTVGPSLGQDAIEKGILAMLIGTALIIVFMIIYYQISGIIVLFALFLNMLIVLATMAAFGATLTLPGIAGLILLISMGTDANVLIFERIREELAQGRTVRSAIEQGYQNALSAILDANLTSIVVGFILMWKGTGPIRGFAVILVIGITASLFTALFVSKLLMTSTFQKRAKISI
ncbi:MAG: protein translocase subunit SecD [Chitinispirillia bacterium]|nr:protein translocase subunit SecD [Chitinispirillia bacterium]MCL2267770.1 protein translocase subunit SecD [Chitinispirillia bacterium]